MIQTTQFYKLAKLIILAITAAVVIVGVFSFRYFFPSDERQIIRRLNDLAEAASFTNVDDGRGQLAAARWAERLARYFTEGATVMFEDVDGQTWSFDNREHLRQTMLAARPHLESLTVAISDPQTLVTEPSIAGRTTVTVQARWREAELESNIWAREVSFNLVKSGRQWFINRAESAPVIKR